MKEHDIAKLFGSGCRAKLLEKFFLEYEAGNTKGFHMRGLSRDLGEQINSIKRELDNLSNMGILKYREELKKKIFYVNPHFDLIAEFTNIFLKSYNPIEKIKHFFSGQQQLDVVIVNESMKHKLLEPGKTILDVFLIGDIDRDVLTSFLGEVVYGRKVKYAVISADDFFHRLEFGDKLIKNILNEKGNIYLRDNLKIKEKI